MKFYRLYRIRRVIDADRLVVDARRHGASAASQPRQIEPGFALCPLQSNRNAPFVRKFVEPYFLNARCLASKNDACVILCGLDGFLGRP